MMLSNTVNNCFRKVIALQKVHAQLDVTSFSINYFADIMEKTPQTNNIHVRPYLACQGNTYFCLLECMHNKVLAIGSSEFKSPKHGIEICRKIINSDFNGELFPFLKHYFFD